MKAYPIPMPPLSMPSCQFLLFSFPSRNPTSPSDGLLPSTSCMSKGGFPVQPYFVLGGFLKKGDEDPEAAEAAGDDEPRYHEATAAVITFIIDNYDAKDPDPLAQKRLRQAKAWEAAFVEYMRRWTANPDNIRHLNVAFFSERFVCMKLLRYEYD